MKETRKISPRYIHRQNIFNRQTWQEINLRKAVWETAFMISM
jgi:hypothetical protein